MTLSLFSVLPAAAQPAFEVASIKPSSADGSHSGTHSNNGRISMDNLSIKQLILTAYNIQNHQYSGPAWLDDERYNIEAKADTKVDQKEMQAMMQTMLADRFKLKVHHESKQVAGYALILAKGGLKLKPVEGEGSSMNTNNTRLAATHVDMPRIARYVSGLLGQPVVDETGIKDSFSFEMEFARPGREDKSETLPTIFTALNEVLGLKLETRKVPIDVIIVDHCERPTDN